MRSRAAQQFLHTFFAEIAELINHKEHPPKAKIAFEVIVQRHRLTGLVSYSLFKRFIRHKHILLYAQKAQGALL